MVSTSPEQQVPLAGWGERRRQPSSSILARIAAVVLIMSASPGFAAQQLEEPRMAATGDEWVAQRRQMVSSQIVRRDVRQEEVLRALELVPRHLFVPSSHRGEAYADHPLPIGWGQTISQPYIVALMTELLELDSNDKVLEIGTGSGYHAAVLSRVAGKVFTIEIIEDLGLQAARTLKSLGYDNVEVKIGDGYQGWPEHAPFDAVILTAAPPELPQPLIDQLRVGGRLVVPLGAVVQDLTIYTKTADGLEKRTVAPVRFVPMTGEAQKGQ